MKVSEDELQIIFDCCKNLVRLDIKNRSRREDYVRGRLIYYKLAFEFSPGSTLTSIGKKVKRDHASVLHNLKNFDRDIMKDKFYFILYSKCRKLSADKLGFVDNLIIDDTDKIKTIWEEKEKEIRMLKDRIELLTHDPLIKRIGDLDADSMEVFTFRADVILKSLERQKNH